MSRFFISHSSVHKKFSEELAAELRGVGHETWLDAFDLHPGDAIPASIVDSIYGSDYFLLVITPEVHTSEWVPWELNIATYREIQFLGRTFVVPGTRVATTPVRMVAHKNHVDISGSPHDAARAIVGVVGQVPVATPLPTDAHLIMMEMTTPAGASISTRRLEEAFWRLATPGPQPYSFFPAALRDHGLSVGQDRVIIGLDEKERITSTILSVDGAIRVAETNFSGGQFPVIQGALLIRKLAKFVKLANDAAAQLGVGSKMDLAIRIVGTDRAFLLSYDPSDLTRFALGALRSQFALPAGQPLTASLRRVSVVNGGLSVESVAQHVDELQADLLHPLRVRPSPLVGGGEFSLRYSSEAVARYSFQALQNIWGP